MLKFAIPVGYEGRPVTTGNVTRDPYGALDKVSGCESENPEIRQIGDITRDLQERLLGITIVSEHKLTDDLQMDEISRAQKEMAGRTDSLYFATDQDGESYFMGNVHAPHGILQSMGSFSPEIHDKLDDYRAIERNAGDRHMDSVLSLLKMPAAPLIIETGAGKDFERIKKLGEFAEKRQGIVVCHDLPPAAARYAGTQDNEFVYLSLPHRHEVLSQAFERNPRPKVITLKDTLSSMSGGSIDQVLLTAAELDADMICATQNLNVANHSNLMPDGFRPNDQNFAGFLMNIALQNFHLFTETDSNFTMKVFVKQVCNAIYNIMMELIRARFMYGAEDFAKLKNRVVLSSTSESIIDANEALGYLTKYFPEFLAAFLRNDFNVMEFGPFGRELAKEKLEPGKLRIRSNQLNFVVGKERPVDFKKLKAGGLPTNVQVIADNDLITPKDKRRINPLTIYCDEESETHGLKCQQIVNRNQTGAIMQLAMQVAKHVVFDIYSKAGLGTYMHKPTAEKINKLY